MWKVKIREERMWSGSPSLDAGNYGADEKRLL